MNKYTYGMFLKKKPWVRFYPKRESFQVRREDGGEIKRAIV